MITKRITCLLLSCCVSITLGYAQPARQPNIVLVLADDLGWKDVGYQGSDFYETPNIDKLAKAGMVFTQAYAGAGNCAPSRAVLLSGQYGPRHGVYAVDSTDRGPKNLMRMIPIANKSGIPPENVTMAEALKAAGYATGIFGKWHLGGKEGAEPNEQGFDVVFNSRPNPNQRRDDPEDPKGIYSLTKAAIGFIEQNKDKPFFAYVAHHAIHTALEARPSSLAKFKAKQPGVQHKAALYAACLYDLDDGVGQLLAKLKELGLDKNTLFIFTSDNGGTQQSSQEPLRGNKGGYYEGGIREPFIAYWPGVIKAGATNTTPIHNVDLNPTFPAAALANNLAIAIYLAHQFARTSRDLAAQLLQVKQLSEKELEHQRTEAELRVQHAQEKAENDRRAKELEEARQLQLSMLPKKLPQLPHLDIAAYMKTATEVGGDYYDFHLGEDGTLTIAVGDATGHGLKAGTMVSVVKGLFVSLAYHPDIPHIFHRLSTVLKVMKLRGLFMAMTMAKVKENRLTISIAGMPPVWIYRAAHQQIEEVALQQLPLGGVTKYVYQQREYELASGDVVVLLSDGLPERFNSQGEMLEDEAAQAFLVGNAQLTAQDLINGLAKLGDEWGGARPQDDDVTLVVLRVK